MQTAESDNLLAVSVEYGHALGWSFTPLAGKRPTRKGWQAAPRETLEEAIQWASEGNVGLRTGWISGVVVIDADPGADLAPLGLPDTVTALTGRSGAKHLYFHYDGPLGNSSGKLAPHVDVKADGGQVVFPGSVHPETGTVYAWAEEHAPWEIPLAEMPTHVIERLTSKAAPAIPPPPPLRPIKQAKTREQRYATMALRLEWNRLYQAQEGSRNDTLNKAAFSIGTLVGAGLLQRDDVEAVLQSAAEAIGLSGKEAAATIRSGLDSGTKNPRQIQTRRDVETAVRHEEDVDPDVPVIPRGQFAMDLYGNADRFCHLFGRDVHWCEDRGKWYVWTGKSWKTDALRDVYRLAETTMRAMLRETRGDEDASKWAGKCNRTASAGREMLEVVKHRTAIPIEALDRRPWLLGAANGVIDLRTGQLLPHGREYLITTLCPAEYEPDTPCPRWEQFLAEIMAGNAEMIASLQRLAGYFLTGDISVQILPIFYGPGSNGKNVLLDTLMGIMGPHAEEAPDGLVTIKTSEEHPTEIADLFGKRLVVASETEENKKLRIGLVKKITGNKYLKGRFMRQDYFQFERTHKTVLVTNNKPVITETSHAIWRRLRLIPFEVTIPEEAQDRHLTDRLVAEWPGILAWAVRGCLEWQARQCDLEFPQAVQEATREYRDDSDPVSDFIAECCIDWRGHEGQGMRTPKERVYLAYSNWCRAVGEDVLSRNAFNSRLRGHGFVDKAAKLPGDSRTQKCWLHLTLKGEGHE